ncbi:MAG TPA: hypothetical protein VK966_08480 [Longimicrobiales bacterium]|nr:hypothetical protein [Longimicrobiales bacterium]
MAMLRSAIFRIPTTEDPKNWRPHLLVLSGAPTRRWPLIDLASSLTHGRGLFTVASILPEGSRDAARRGKLEATVRDYLSRRGVQALVRLTTADDVFTGSEQLVEAYGLGPLAPNTILVGANVDPANRERYCRMLRRVHEARRNVVVLRVDPERGFGERRRIHVWWGGLQRNGGLMIILAYLVRISAAWPGSELSVKLVVNDPAGAEPARRNIEDTIEGLRIGTDVEVLVSGGRPFPEILRESSSDADLVFLGMAEPEEDFATYYAQLQERSQGLPAVAFVLAAQDLDFAQMLE